MPLADWIGAIAATLTTASFVPQMLQTFRSKDASGISLGNVQRIHSRRRPVAGLRPATGRLARRDRQRDHGVAGVVYFGDEAALPLNLRRLRHRSTSCTFYRYRRGNHRCALG